MILEKKFNVVPLTVNRLQILSKMISKDNVLGGSSKTFLPKILDDKKLLLIIINNYISNLYYLRIR